MKLAATAVIPACAGMTDEIGQNTFWLFKLRHASAGWHPAPFIQITQYLYGMDSS